MCLED
ncbi:hypothetical protein VCHC59B1_3526A, partial [Vibrio cholerae HC-59B1]